MEEFISRNYYWIISIPFVILIGGGVLDFIWYMYSQGQKKWESIMKPCPKCGHKAIIVWYNGENDPQFYMPECGAYFRRQADANDLWWGEIYPPNYFNDQPPMTDKQKECNHLAGIFNKENENVPHFSTPRAAAIWWNRHVKQVKKKLNEHKN